MPPVKTAITGSLSSVDLDATASACPVKPVANVDHTVGVRNLRPGLIDNVTVTSRSTKSLFDFGGANNNWSHNFGLIPNQTGFWNRNHERTKTVQMTATGPEGNDDVIDSSLAFTYKSQTNIENITGVDYLLQIRK